MISRYQRAINSSSRCMKSFLFHIELVIDPSRKRNISSEKSFQIKVITLHAQSITAQPAVKRLPLKKKGQKYGILVDWLRGF